MPARAFSLLLVACVACTREAADEICPELVAGDLVVTEVRGEQTSGSLAQWIELYNATGRGLELIGLHVRVRAIDGSDEDRIIIRRDLSVGPGAYFTIGVGDDAARPPYVDYAAGTDTGNALFANAAIEVEACGGEQIDQVVYRGLTREGTYSLGLSPPTAAGNDPDSVWCNNQDDDGSMTFPGTPQAANPPCP